MKLVFANAAWDDYIHWSATSEKTRQRINDMIRQCQRTPFSGIGKPEPLRGDLKGWWSRRITQEHRMVYRVLGTDADQRLEIAQLRFHY